MCVTFPYKAVINNHSVTIGGNPILFNCSQRFKQKFHITAFLNIECKKYKNLEAKCVTTNPGLLYLRWNFEVRVTKNNSDNHTIIAAV